MPTTTLRIPEKLKARIAELAARSGKTAHAFMLEAIEERVRQYDARAEYVDEAQGRLQQLLESGHGIDWQDMRAYLEERAAGRKPSAPGTRSWRK